MNDIRPDDPPELQLLAATGLSFSAERLQLLRERCQEAKAAEQAMKSALESLPEELKAALEALDEKHCRAEDLHFVLLQTLFEAYVAAQLRDVP